MKVYPLQALLSFVLNWFHALIVLIWFLSLYTSFQASHATLIDKELTVEMGKTDIPFSFVVENTSELVSSSSSSSLKNCGLSV